MQPQQLTRQALLQSVPLNGLTDSISKRINCSISFIQANVEKVNKALQSDMSDASNRLDDLAQSLNDADISKKKLGVEKVDLEKQISEGDNQIRMLGKLKTSLGTQVSKQELNNSETSCAKVNKSI
jgi:hypothetical protein